jgi:hypothetical protein
MRRPVILIVAIGSLVAATLWLVFKSRHPTIERATLAYVPGERAARERSPAPAASEAATEKPPSPRPQTEVERALEPPRFHVRPEGEWQGMLVNLNVQPPCDGPGLCGMALACKNGRCGPCEFDAECGPGESCVLDHCLRSANVRCHRTADCGPQSTCILSGYSTGARGNADMRAYCLALESGAGQSAPAPAGPPPKDLRQNLPNDDLLGAANKARQQ